MAGKLTLKLTNRSPKQPIKRLPASLDISPETTVEEIKVIIARQAGISDHNRVGIFDPETKKTLKNRKAQIGTEAAVISAGELLIKDLGPQVSWRTVFIIEYAGPVLLHLAVLALRPLLYSNGDKPMSQTQWLGFALFAGHFFKREIETIFVHRFSASTMPARNIIKNSAYYWALSGLLCAWEIYAPWSASAKADDGATTAVIGVLIYLFGEISNAIVHLNLASLRSPGGTERAIPRGYGTSLVTCPNYMFEIISWIGVAIALCSWSTTIFLSGGTYQMLAWAKGKERAYRKEFPETYKKKKFVLLPGLL
ncbi:3-oxo-5-alpha-steroid 4-dehydrogenase [Plectosphaerella plurivora]|uniref:3-oxo-5-alpha-steroid 4-dehydrogenase n=1 Tax=Plectosphaerella plurivora TaxID=936078 RepID=A0A9P8VD40_9PEZI|nr:3-oxo-5-alpha-steroid 4-dehydrogenase [Plectosphaerella plurivora]